MNGSAVMSTENKTPKRVNADVRPRKEELGYPAGLIAVLFDKLNRLTDRWGPLLVFIGFMTLATMLSAYFARDNYFALTAVMVADMVAIGAAIYARIRGLI
jgi:hypothetical protein